MDDLSGHGGHEAVGLTITAAAGSGYPSRAGFVPAIILAS
jgi:hypothetical protein